MVTDWSGSRGLTRHGTCFSSH